MKCTTMAVICNWLHTMIPMPQIMTYQLLHHMGHTSPLSHNITSTTYSTTSSCQMNKGKNRTSTTMHATAANATTNGGQ